MLSRLLGFPSVKLGLAVISRIGKNLGVYCYENAYRGSDSVLSVVPPSNSDLRDQRPMGPRSQLGRLEHVR